MYTSQNKHIADKIPVYITLKSTTKNLHILTRTTVRAFQREKKVMTIKVTPHGRKRKKRQK